MTEISRKELEERKACQFHIYGRTGALEWYPVVTRKGFYTLGVDAAKVAEKQSKPDWSGKMMFQLTREELPVFLAVLCGFQDTCQFSGHGSAHDKGFEIRAQENSFLIRVYQRDFGAVAVPAASADAFYLLSLGVRQLIKGQPWLHGQNIPALLRATLKRPL